jgi:hypothetical protein
MRYDGGGYRGGLGVTTNRWVRYNGLICLNVSRWSQIGMQNRVYKVGRLSPTFPCLPLSSLHRSAYLALQAP